MLVIVSGRQTGKTTRLLQLMVDNPEMVLVTFSEEAAVHAWKQARDNGMDLARHRFMSVSAVTEGHGLRGLYDPKLLIDNAELVLATLLGVMPVAATMTATKL